MKKLACMAALTLSLSNVAVAENKYYDFESFDKNNFKVTVTNITRGESFTPILATTHKQAFSLFELGQPASEELSTLAESGNITPLNELFDAHPKLVRDTISTDGLLLPGESVSFEIDGRRGFNYLSLAAMLIPTNDTYVAADTIKLPRYGKVEYLLRAYDAGSETNDELCINIPGPACGGEGGSPDDDGEGYVHISAGIHGEGDLLASDYDWRDVVAKVVIQRMH
jgi:spondin N